MDNKQRKLFVIKQSKGCKVMPKMHSNMFGGLREGRGGGLLLTGRKGGNGGKGDGKEGKETPPKSR